MRGAGEKIARDKNAGLCHIHISNIFLLILSSQTGFDFVFPERMMIPLRFADNKLLRKIYRRMAITMFCFAASMLFIPSLPANLHAQNPPIHFDRLLSELGLSQNLVSAIMQDRKGFLWIGTKDGLNRFDGYKFTVFRHNPFDSTSLSDNYITALLEDRAGRIWVGTLRGGLNLFDRATETFSHSMPDSANPNSLSHSRITAIAEDQSRESGTIWIGTWGGGVNRLVFPAGAKTLAGAIYTRFMHDPNNSNSLGNNIISVFTVAKDTVWVVTNFAGHYQIIPTADRRNFEVRPARWGSDLPIPEWQKRLETNVQTYAFGQGKNGKIWIGRENGFNCWDAIAGQYTFHGLAAKNFMGLKYSFLEDRTGILWAGHSQGLRRYDLTAGTVADLRHDPNNPHSIAESGINAIYEDSGGILWFGSNGNGLFKYDPKVAPFSRPHRGAAKLSLWRGTSIRALCETRDPAPAVVWLSAAAGPLLHLNRTTGEIAAARFNSPDEFGLEVVFSMLQDKKGVLWVGNTIGLHRLEWHEGKLKAISYYEPEPDGKIENLRDGVYKIFEDRQGEIWIATITHLARLDQHSRRFVKYRFSAAEPSTIQEYAYPFIHQDRRGVFWLGTLDGLQRFDPVTASFKRYQNDPRDSSSISFNVVRAIHEDPFQPDKYLWLGTAGGGLNRFDRETETFTHFTEKDGLPDKVVYAILSDKAGNLWMSTNKGLAKFNPVTHAFKNYYVNDGLQDNEFNSCAYFKSANGELFFGGINGFNAFYPEDIQGNPHVPPVALTGFQIFNKPVSFTAPDSPLKTPISEATELTLAYDQKVFSFEFAALDFTDPSKNQYAYKMENFDNDWRVAGTSRTATYTNLNPGDYVFRVKGSNNDGVWNEEGVALNITITPPWWRTWWAYAFSMLAAAAALVGFIKRREYALRKRTHALEAAVVERTAQVQMQNERLEAQAHKLQELDHLKSNFFANISHEFRTPLTLIMGQIDSALAAVSEMKLKARLEMAFRNAQQLLRLINQLLDLSRLEAGRMELRAVQGNIVPLLKSLTYTFESLALKKRINLRFQTTAEDIKLYHEPEKIEKIMHNLLSNAFKFTPEGGSVLVNVRVANDFGLANADFGDQQGKSAIRNPQSAIEISVRDTGIGIPKEHLPHVFDRFYQVDSSTTREHEGTGIGLALTKELVELHGGEISVESEEGFGTTFAVRLPLGVGRRAKSGGRRVKSEKRKAKNLFMAMSNEQPVPPIRDNQQ